MIAHFYSASEDLLALRRGQLGPHMDSFAARLSEQGYSRSFGRQKIELVADLSQWLDRRRLRVQAQRTANRRLPDRSMEGSSPHGRRPVNVGTLASTLFGLLAATGMRVGEALSLDRQDVDLEQALLTVRQAKGNRSRLVPLHPSTRNALRRYERLRDQICPHPTSPSFFSSERGARLIDCTVRYWFIRISHQTGLRQPTDHRGPRLHDLRHRFSIKTLLHWYRTDRDVEAHLPELATYLGHRHVADTYWYLSATPELLQLATRRWVRGKGGTLS